MTISFYSPAQIIALMRAERQEVESELLNAYRYLTEQREGTQSHNLGKQRVRPRPGRQTLAPLSPWRLSSALYWSTTTSWWSTWRTIWAVWDR